MTDRETPAGAVEALAAIFGPIWVSGGIKGDLHAGTDPTCQEYAAKTLDALTASGYSLTRSVDVERWQRIETAAQNLADDWASGYPQHMDANVKALIVALRDALGKGQK